MEYTKKPTRNYEKHSSTPWRLWEVMYARRSHRKFLPMEPDPALADSLQEVIRLSAKARGARQGSVSVHTEPDTVERMKKRACKGFANKINLWLPRVPAAGFVLLSVDRSDLGLPRPSELPAAVMTVEDCVLWLTERGLGTCWLAGVNGREMVEAAGLADGLTVPVAVPFGRPKDAARGADFDGVLYRSLSRKRKTLSQIASLESADRPYDPDVVGDSRFSAPGVQDVSGLIGLLGAGGTGGGDGRAPLDLAVDACLEAARIAPNGGNFQAWRFVVVRESGRLASLEKAAGSSGGWVAAIAGAGATRRFESGVFDKPFWMLDVPIALSHISLMAVASGYGAETLVEGIDEDRINRICGLAGGTRCVGVVGLK